MQYKRTMLLNRLRNLVTRNDQIIHGPRKIGKTHIGMQLVSDLYGISPPVPSIRFDFTGVRHDVTRDAISDELVQPYDPDPSITDIIKRLNHTSAEHNNRYEIPIPAVCMFDNFEQLHTRQRQNYREFMQECNADLNSNWRLIAIVRTRTIEEYALGEIFGDSRLEITPFNLDEMREIFIHHPALAHIYEQSDHINRELLHNPRYLKMAYYILEDHDAQDLTLNERNMADEPLQEIPF